MLSPVSQVVIDAGPLIALLYAKDPQHRECRIGFEQLSQAKVRAYTPIPILFEVYKWLLYTTNPRTAQSSLNTMLESLHLIPVNQADLLEISALLQTIPNWQGSLEDATVIWAARVRKCPVWTINYRDFGNFPALEFWNPDLN
ncbi:MAG TPA: type II toxin-antitoxin system VapC family toxin [Nostoc sp.]|uniref:type II toxin-antitoxin system VapC family toxin n=1 Tax=Nostoc sp. TaxID=1180 RepID=UPI002D5C608D|nr:type II toxin-antitoxin system VapC family toxin [Nostoc sp.]HYX16642.1 type II toxin-antitoxin system VapC family toxin [Nostoc sp.]